MFAEQGLVGQNRGDGAAARARLRLARLRHRCCWSASAWSPAGRWSYARNQAYVAEVEATLPDLQAAVDSMPPANQRRRDAAAHVLTRRRGAAPQPAGFALDDAAACR